LLKEIGCSLSFFILKYSQCPVLSGFLFLNMGCAEYDPILRQAENQGLNKEKPPLTPRQIEILELVAIGKTNLEIARNLEISEETVKNHLSYEYGTRRGIFSRLNVNSRREAVVKAIVELRLLDPGELVSEEELGRLKSLSEREMEVLSHLADPSLPSFKTTDREIGNKLGGISPQTIKNHLNSIFKKLEIRIGEQIASIKSPRAAVIFLAYQQRQESTFLSHERLHE